MFDLRFKEDSNCLHRENEIETNLDEKKRLIRKTSKIQESQCFKNYYNIIYTLK